MNDPYCFPRVQVLPRVEGASFLKDGAELVGYHAGTGGTRPFLFPVIGPSGAALTRLGHPNPVGHEHHRSIWFGHQSVGGVNFWEDRPGTDIRIIHRRIRVLQDGSDSAGLVADLDWWARGMVMLTQRLTLALEPAPDDAGLHLDIQSRFEVPASGGVVHLGKTNFGFLGVRVAKTMSEQFGGGRLTSAEGRTGEPAIFGRRSRWVDYSGPVAPGKVDGICYMDHPQNPRSPSHWHVRSDGWMCASFNLDEPYGLARDHPLDLRYRLLLHAGPADARSLERAWDRFAATPPYTVSPGPGHSLATIERRRADA